MLFDFLATLIPAYLLGMLDPIARFKNNILLAVYFYLTKNAWYI